MCTFNGEAFVREQLESIASQSRPPDELVVCDDGSADSTVRVMKDFASTAPLPVRMACNEQRLGFTKNFEKAISMCRGDFIALCDQDDIWHPEKLSVQESALRTGEVGGVFSDGDVVGRNLEPLGYTVWESLGFTRRHRALVLAGRAVDVLNRRDFVTGATLMFDARYRQTVLPVPDGWNHDGWIAFVLGALGRLTFVDRVLFRYRQHGGNQIGAEPPAGTTARFGVGLSTVRRMHPDTTGVLRRCESGSARLRQLSAHGIEPALIADMEAKAAHLRERLSLPRTRRERLPIVLRELASRRYSRYSAGLRSAAKDMVRQ
jgi:glycosyltransferase involved in cell wall biosynthesis